MKTVLKQTIAALMFASVASAGPISSGGVNKVLESCKSVDNNVRLQVLVVNSDHLEAQFLDASDINAIHAPISTVVHSTEDGYANDEGDFVISMSVDGKGRSFATVLISSMDPSQEPSVYAGLSCGHVTVK